jgi:hypothetical protein
VRKYHEG